MKKFMRQSFFHACFVKFIFENKILKIYNLEFENVSNFGSKKIINV